MEVDILGVDTSGVDILGVDILRVDILEGTHLRLRLMQVNKIASTPWVTLYNNWACPF